jgi:hypothetical protein
MVTWQVTRAGHMRKGRRAGRVIPAGYRCIQIDGRRHPEHCLVFLWMTGEWPEAEIDHINRDKSDNRWVNLREARRTENIANSVVRVDSKIGLKGVARRESARRFRAGWVATISINRRRHSLGFFDNMRDAAIAYDRAATLLFGPFALLNFGPEENAGRRVLSDRAISKLIIAKLKDWAREVATIQSDEAA